MFQPSSASDSPSRAPWAPYGPTGWFEPEQPVRQATTQAAIAMKLRTTMIRALAQSEIVKTQRAAVCNSLGLDGLGGTGGAVHHGDNADHVAARVLDGTHRRQRRGSGDADVLQDHRALARNLRPPDKTLQAMGFRSLAPDERVNRSARRVHDGRG